MKRYTWFEASGIALLVDTEREKILGSIIPQVNGECIIRYGHSSDREPMHEDVVEAQGNDRDTIFVSAGRILARLEVSLHDEDDRALFRFADQGGIYHDEIKPEYLEGCKNG